ncbi:urease accessory protein UreD [Roseovarius atlanticus]|nr:urease accessory protein UreD [Roseovarius atlanticus]MBY6124852.1 urease accessory protein UreD [Roseovarius atlanticus]MBY6149347.1 urease accessory protein UreD [Roseovarius atlanticus]
MLLAPDITAHPDGPALPRARGSLRVASKLRDGRAVLDRLHSAGCARALFPRRTDALEAIVVNTSGGLTGGDRFDIEATAGAGSRLVVTTQAAERAYRSNSGRARVRSRLHVEAGATLCWLPQELLVFDGAALDRRLEVEIEDTAEFIMAEPVVFGRLTMGETVTRADFLDRVSVRRDNRPLYEDRVALTDDIPARLGLAAVAAGMTAMASALYIGHRAESLLSMVRALLPATGGASLLRPDVLVVRVLARDGFELRRTLCPVLEALSNAALPRSWRL